MVEKRDPKEHLEAILGHELFDAVSIDSAVGLWSVEHVPLGNRTSRVLKVFPDGGLLPVKVCGGTELLTVGGITHTGREGRVELRLSEFHCVGTGQIHHPVIFVATARTSSPVFVAAAAEITADGGRCRTPRWMRAASGQLNCWIAGGAFTRRAAC